MSLLEWIAVGFSIAYLLLAVRNEVWCFVVGFVSSVLWAYVSLDYYNLKWDALLNAFYAVMSVYGWFAWQYGDPIAQRQALPITSRSALWHVGAMVGVSACTALLTWSGSEILDTNYPFWDSLSTVLSVFGTFLLTRRIISTWMYLLVADLIYIGIYGLSGAYLFMGMMVVYSVMAVVGYRSWMHIKQQA